jgi:hypothetical protein
MEIIIYEFGITQGDGGGAAPAADHHRDQGVAA